ATDLMNSAAIVAS
ncbi:hypothetical protein D030_4107B, partial [Vibrio parahaemolyticus AQ3810]